MADPITNADQAIEAAAKVRAAIRDFWIHDVNKLSWFRDDQNERLVQRITASLKDRVASPSDGAVADGRNEVTEEDQVEANRMIALVAEGSIESRLKLARCVAALRYLRSRPRPDLRAQVAFLLDRISELDWSQDRDDFARDWHGHVEPALQRVADEINRALSDGAKGN